LVVAITVILAALVSVFALDVGESVQEAGPQVSFEFEQENVTFRDASYGGGSTGAKNTTRVVTVTHAAGDTIERENLQVLINGERQGWDAYGMGTESDGTASDGTARRPVSSQTVSETLSSGDSARIVFADPDVTDGSSITISATTGEFNDQSRSSKPAIAPLEEGDTITL
jgi:FlaG/FlaF family flagellin (archaellin)